MKVLDVSKKKKIIFVLIGILYAFIRTHGFIPLEYWLGLDAYRWNEIICTILVCIGIVLNTIFPLNENSLRKKILTFILGCIIVLIVSLIGIIIIFFLTPMSFGD